MRVEIGERRAGTMTPPTLPPRPDAQRRPERRLGRAEATFCGDPAPDAPREPPPPRGGAPPGPPRGPAPRARGRGGGGGWARPRGEPGGGRLPPPRLSPLLSPPGAPPPRVGAPPLPPAARPCERPACPS